MYTCTAAFIARLKPPPGVAVFSGQQVDMHLVHR